LSIYRAIASDADNPPCSATFSTATSRCDVLTTRLLEAVPARISRSSPRRPGPAAVPAPEPTPKPRPPEATSGRGELPGAPET
jgi:hypothetical protein